MLSPHSIQHFPAFIFFLSKQHSYYWCSQFTFHWILIHRHTPHGKHMPFFFTNKMPSATAPMFVNHFRDAVFSHMQSESNNIRRNISLWNTSHTGLMKKKKKRGRMARSTARFMSCTEFLSRTSQRNDWAFQPPKDHVSPGLTAFASARGFHVTWTCDRLCLGTHQLAGRDQQHVLPGSLKNYCTDRK